MRVAYADPPYLGSAAKFYAEMHDDAAAFDSVEAHAALIGSLAEYDGWALSMSSVNLRTLLPLCPEDVRVMAWVKTWASWKPGVSPKYCWEPLVVKAARKPRSEPVVRDFVACPAAQKGFRGAKPFPFIRWMFQVVGLEPDDDFTDMFPGSGAVTHCFHAWRSQGVLTFDDAPVLIQTGVDEYVVGESPPTAQGETV